MVRFVLASSSPRRRELLSQINIIPDVILSPDINEDALKAEIPTVYVKRMVSQKMDMALKLWKDQSGNPDAVILTADTVVSCGRRILPKAMTLDEARFCVDLLSGRKHRVMTAVAVGRLNSDKVKIRMVQTSVQVKRLSDKEKKVFLESGEWHGKAGGYALQGVFARFIESLNGSPSGVIGLPLCETSRLLESEGIL